MLTIYAKQKILNEIFGATAFAAPGTLYLGLSTTTINSSGTGITEPSAGAAYARVTVTNNTTNFPAPTTTGNKVTKATGAEFTFPEATGSWGTVTHFFISDAITGGNILVAAALTAQKAIAAGDVARFKAGELTVSLE